MSTKRRTLGVYSSPQPKDAEGRRLCRNCLKVLQKGQRFNCSHNCSEEWRGKTSPAYMRHLVYRRDKGVCAVCRIDTDGLKRAWESIPRGDKAESIYDTTHPRSQFLKAHGIPWGRASADWWDADHITPVVEGGGECGLSNYRTLCIPCHKKETAALRGRLAAVERQKRAVKNDAQGMFADQLPLSNSSESGDAKPTTGAQGDSV